MIVTQSLTDGSAQDARKGLGLLASVNREVATFTGDGAYDSVAIYMAASARGAAVVVPPSKVAAKPRRRMPKSAERDRTIKRVREVGRRRWKKEAGYHAQGRVENTFFRLKSIVGGRLRARVRGAQETEAVLACNVLNRMRALGWPTSEKTFR